MQVPRKLPPQLVDKVFRYRITLGFVLAFLLIGYVVFQINQLSSVGRNEDHYNDAMSKVRSYKFDDETIKTIRGLQEPDVIVEPSLPSGRTNPF